MPKAIFIIRANGDIEQSEQKAAPKLAQLQKAVGGYIETVPHFTHLEHEGKKYTRGLAYCNEYGKLHNLPVNANATKAWLACLGKGPFRYEPILRGDVIFYATTK